MTTIPSSSPSLCSLKLFRLSSRESLIDGAFLGNRTKPSQSLHLQFRMEAVSSISTSLSCISVGEDFPAEYEQWLPVPDPETRRRAGILLHPTSFRGPHGIGDLGEEAFRFILLVAPFGRFFLWFLKTKEDLLMQDRASDKCQREKKKAINGDDLLWAMATLGFEDYIEPLKVYLTRYREISRMLLMARIMVWDNNLDTRHEVPFDSQDED